jgi:Antibiotic biosynthesis monooxygenase
MTAFNIVRFRVKPGREQHFIAAHRDFHRSFKGFRGGALVKTGERTFCIIGEWASLQKLAQARPQMIGVLDSIREDLEDLGGGLGVTDPVSGDVVVKLAASKPTLKKPRKASAKAAKRKKRQ